MNISPEERKQFESLTAGLGLEVPLEATPTRFEAGPTDIVPCRRRAPLSSVVGLRITARLAKSNPPIWRQVMIRSDANLMDLHNVLQAAFEWEDRHLFQFSFAPPFTKGAELFLCPWEASDGEQGTPSFMVRLDEVMQETGDVLHYVYDYGDNWDLVLELDEVVPESDVVDRRWGFARLKSGHGAAPPEDCGGLRTAEELQKLSPSPRYLDLNSVSGAVYDVNPLPPVDIYPDNRSASISGDALSPRINELLDRYDRFRGVARGPDYQAQLELLGRLDRLVQDAPAPSSEERADSLSLITWALEHLHGVKLTQAGYLPPKLVRPLLEQTDHPFMTVSGPMRESDHHQAYEFRTALTRLGLLRKYRGELVRTKLGTQALKSPEGLWEVLTQQLRPQNSGTFDDDAGAFMLLTTATSQGKFDLKAAARLMAASGWDYSDGSKIKYHEVGHAENGIAPILGFTGPINARRQFGNNTSDVAVALARAALLKL